MMLLNLLEQNDIHPTEIKDAIICSVVPNVMHSLRGGLVKYFHITPIVVEAGIKTGIRIVTPNPQQIGADRIVDAVGAYEIYGGPVLVIDFGTATTYDYVDESGAFQGGITAPGIRISAKALWEDAAKLPEIEIKKPASILGVRFEEERLECDNYQGNAVVNYTDREVPYTRIIEHKHFTFGTQSFTIISREYSSEWKPGIEPYYPINDAKNSALAAKYQELAAKAERVIFGGRLGSYKYYDMDKVIASALALVEKELA